MKKLMLLLTLLSISATASQAQLLKSKVVAPTIEGTANVTSVADERRVIEGVPMPSVTNMRSAKRVSQYKPSGFIYGTRIYSNIWSD